MDVSRALSSLPLPVHDGTFSKLLGAAIKGLEYPFQR